MKTTIFAGLLLCCASVYADPPELIRVIRGDGVVPPYGQAKKPVMVLGMFAVSGVSEPWLIEAHGSFESIETVDSAISGFLSRRRVTNSAGDDVLPASRNVIALYRAGLSYRPDEAEKGLPKSHYLMVSVYRVRPGADAGFSELVNLRRARFDSINLDRPEIAYQVISGAAAGTYLFLTPLVSLKVLDEGLAKMPVYAQGVRETAATAGQKLAGDAEIGHEVLLFRLDPQSSLVSDDFAAGDPEFWRPPNQ